MLTDDLKIAEKSNFFSDVIKTRNIENNDSITCNTGNKKILHYEQQKSISFIQVLYELKIPLRIKKTFLSKI